MQTNLLWAGREYYSLENCLVQISRENSIIYSTIIGRYDEKIYHVDYEIRTNEKWETVFLRLCTRHSNIRKQIILEGDEKGNWMMNGQEAVEFKGCRDVDISLTPFTNTLAINRLDLHTGAASEVQVIYCDVLQQQLKPVRQKYTRLSATQYHYENVPNDFEATITVDEWGLVLDYPGLFVRTATLGTSYLL